MFLRRITLVNLVAVHFLVCLLIHIQILLFLLLGLSLLYLSVERSVKRKGYDRTISPFCIRVAFDTAVGGYVVKVCQLSHLDHVANFPSIVGYVKFEANLSTEERSQLVNFGKIDYTDFQSKNGLSRLFSNRTYDSDMIYRVVKKARIGLNSLSQFLVSKTEGKNMTMLNKCLIVHMHLVKPNT